MAHRKATAVVVVAVEEVGLVDNSVEEEEEEQSFQAADKVEGYLDSSQAASCRPVIPKSSPIFS